MTVPKTKSAKSAVTRQAFLDAGREVFDRKGFAGTQIRDITDRLGVVRGAFYYYFRDKRELFIELGTLTVRETKKAVLPIRELPQNPTRAEVQGWVRGYFDYLDLYGAFAIRSVEDSPADPAFQQTVARVHVQTAAIVGAEIARLSGRELHDVSATGVCVMAMMERSWFLVRNTKAKMTREGTITALSELLMAMVAP
jgi:AcrR family transcriptional regulator